MSPATEMGALRMDTGARSHRSSTEATALHETAFFRDRAVFEALRETVLPRLIAANSETRKLRVWCAGCATGQEAYSIAMLLRESFAEQLAGWDVKVVGTDQEDDAAAYARRGRYRRAEVNRGLPARMLVKYFVREDEEWEIADELRAMCEFRRADVRLAGDDGEMYDLVLMRNLLLLLSAQERGAAFANVHRRTAAQGVLGLGEAERAEDSTEMFEAEYAGRCCFYRPLKKA